MTSDTGRPSDASSPPSPDQARRPLLAGPETQTRSFEASRATQGEARPGRFSMLRSFAASRQPSILLQRRHPADITAASASPLSSRSSLSDFHPGGLTDANLGNRPEPASGTGPSGRATTSNVTTSLDRLAITSSFAAHLASASNNTSQRPSITASGSPSLILRVSTNDGVTGARVNPRVGAPPSGRSTPTVGGSSSAGSARTVGGAPMGRGTPAGGGGATANVAMPASGSLPVRAGGAQTAGGGPPATGAMPAHGSLPIGLDGAQTAGNGPAAGDTILADGALPAAGGAPAVGTMPAIGRVAYITVQSPDNRVSFPGHSSTGLYAN